MAHERGGPPLQPDAQHEEPATSPGARLIEPDATEVVRDVSSIDHLLALTDDGWDLDSQVKTLKQAALRPPRIPAPPPKKTGLHVPTPLELAPTIIGPAQAAFRGNPGEAARPSAAPGMAPAMKGLDSKRPPPPLPRPPGAPHSHTPTHTPSHTPDPSSRPSPTTADIANPGTLVELLQARLATLESNGDKVGLARTHVELAVVSETVLSDDVRAAMHAEAALKVDFALPAAHGLLRRRKHGRAALPQILEHLEHELAAATSEAAVVELLADKARLLEVGGDRADAARSTWEQALSRAPQHAAALKGLEAELATRAAAGDLDAAEALANHLATMASAYGSEPTLAAWLHVERARVLERTLSRADAARAALERAVELDPSVGPVRDALVRHAAVHADWKRLAELLAAEADVESLDSRCAALEVDAACILHARLHENARAVELLEKAVARAPTEASVDRRALDELVRIHDADGNAADAIAARRLRLRFVAAPSAIAHELRVIAIASEKLGDLDGAIADIQRAIAVMPDDATLVETLDRLLAAVGKDEQRIAVWVTEAARTDDATKRARALGRAADITEHGLARPIDAVRHLRAAWVAAPGDAEVLDSLSRLLSPSLSETADKSTRALVDLYTQAAEHAREPARRVAYLEKVALLREEVLGDAKGAASAYEEVLAIEPSRTQAILGLERTSARLGDVRGLARALLEEARLSEDGAHRLALETRAAAALAKVDVARATSLVRDVLAIDPAHSAARALETRLHQDAGQWELAAKSLYARIDIAPTPPEKVALWLLLAELQNERLHAPHDALSSLQAARALDPKHPVPPEQIAVVLAATGDLRALRAAVEQLATHAETPADRARFLIEAAELDELRVGDDASAARLYARALAETPDDDFVADRLARVLARRGATSDAGFGELAGMLTKRIERAVSPPVANGFGFDLASLLADLGIDTPRAVGLLESVLTEQPDHVPALRVLEGIHRRSGDWAALGRDLSREADAFVDVRAKLGALWGLAALEEWRLPVSDATITYKKILELDPSDPGALEANVRRDLGAARRGDTKARRAVISSLRSLVAFAPDDGARLAIQIRLALLLEAAATEASEGADGAFAHEALDRYRDALRLDELSVTAATGLVRLSNRLGDAEGSVAAACALVELSVDPRTRSRYLVDAAEILLGPDDDARLGGRDERRKRATGLLERALDAEPDSIAAAGRLATILLEDGAGEHLVELFRSALVRAKAADAIVMLGSEIAQVARDELKDLTVAIDAMRRVRAAAPQHVPSLLTLAELCIAQRAWPDAVDALEAVVSTSREVTPRMTALFALASVYEKVLMKPAEVERVLRAALALEPSNVRALRALLRRLASLKTTGGANAHLDEEIAETLERLARAEPEHDQKSDLLSELAEARTAMGDAKGAERALIEAVAYNPSNARAFARLAGHYKIAGGRDHAAYARGLAAVIGLGKEIGTSDARWLAALGQLEIESLGRVRDGVTHLQRATEMDPRLYETRFELASAYARLSANEEATRALLDLITPTARPLLALADPAAALELLERSLGAERRGEDALVVSELRAIGGGIDDGRHAWLRARRLGPVDPGNHILDRTTLVTHVLPVEARHVLLEVAAAISGIEAKILRADLSELGLTSKDRVSARSGHPTRLLLDRLVKQLGLGEVELVITPNVPRTRVLAHDVPWIVVPRALADLTEPTQLASLGRALARIAFGVPWLEELPPAHIEALLVAAARQVVPGYASDEVDVIASKLVQQHESGVARALTRRQKKLLEELAPHIAAPQGKPMPIDDFVGALSRAELRAAYIVTGDLLATLDELRANDPLLHRATSSPSASALAAVLEHPVAGDVARFALTTEATALRRRVGATWT